MNSLEFNTNLQWFRDKLFPFPNFFIQRDMFKRVNIQSKIELKVRWVTLRKIHYRRISKIFFFNITVTKYKNNSEILILSDLLSSVSMVNLEEKSLRANCHRTEITPENHGVKHRYLQAMANAVCFDEMTENDEFIISPFLRISLRQNFISQLLINYLSSGLSYHLSMHNVYLNNSWTLTSKSVKISSWEMRIQKF